jgi:CHASE2 domain-containing sensor protein
VSACLKSPHRKTWVRQQANADLSSSSVITILFPVFASYKALRTSDPSQLAPWLMYWVVLSVILLAESWTVFIIGWYIPHFKPSRDRKLIMDNPQVPIL